MESAQGQSGGDLKYPLVIISCGPNVNNTNLVQFWHGNYQVVKVRTVFLFVFIVKIYYVIRLPNRLALRRHFLFGYNIIFL